MQHVYAVHELTTYLRELVESDPLLGDLWVSGEVSNVSRPASGHVYFTLKDAAGQMRAVFFQSRYRPGGATARDIENGKAVVVHGRAGFYEQRGDLQIIVDFVQPEGGGLLQLEFERLKAKLQEEGLFDDAAEASAATLSPTHRRRDFGERRRLPRHLPRARTALAPRAGRAGTGASAGAGRGRRHHRRASPARRSRGHRRRHRRPRRRFARRAGRVQR